MNAVTPGQKGNQFNLAVQARRQPGSTFKTFVLTTAVAKGINPASSDYVSAPFEYQPNPKIPVWNVTTYDHSYVGWISIEQATLRSDNTVYAQLTIDVGPSNVIAMAHRLGIQSPLAARALDRARHGRRLAARDGVRLRDAVGGRDLLAADGDHEGRAAEREDRQGRRLGQAGAEARHP